MTILLWVYGQRVHGLPQSTVHLRLTDDGGLRLCLGQPPHTRWKAPGPRLHGNNSNYIYCEHDQATTPRSPVSNGVYKEFHAAQLRSVSKKSINAIPPQPPGPNDVSLWQWKMRPSSGRSASYNRSESYSLPFMKYRQIITRVLSAQQENTVPNDIITLVPRKGCNL